MKSGRRKNSLPRVRRRRIRFGWFNPLDSFRLLRALQLPHVRLRVQRSLFGRGTHELSAVREPYGYPTPTIAFGQVDKFTLGPVRYPDRGRKRRHEDHAHDTAPQVGRRDNDVFQEKNIQKTSATNKNTMPIPARMSSIRPAR